jgi:hypothetical protein
MTNSWIQIDGKLIPKDEYTGDNTRGMSFQVMPDIQPLQSPIDGSIINSRPQLKAHNAKHGVTNSADYSPEFLAKRRKETHMQATGQDKASQQERIQTLSRAYDNPQPLKKQYHMPGPGKTNPKGAR